MPGYRPETWNPIVGCSKVSPGCDNCYAEKMAMRIPYMLEKSKSETYYAYSNVVNKQGWNGHTCLNTDHIDNPLQWKSPRMIFVCSMSDLFHKNVPCNWINQVMQVIRQCPQHLFIILTKRPEIIKDKMTGDFPENVWLGVTAENQEMANKRIPILLQIKAAKRFVSIEPMLGPIDFDEFNMMKETAVFINASRGEIINEQALIEALQNKKIFGAGLDVYEKGIVDSKNVLLKMSNVVTLPHIGSAVEKTRIDMAMLAAKNLVEALLGKVPANMVPELKK